MDSSSGDSKQDEPPQQDGEAEQEGITRGDLGRRARPSSPPGSCSADAPPRLRPRHARSPAVQRAPGRSRA